MAEFEWRASDARDLIRRDRMRLLRDASPAILAAGLLAFWLRHTAPGWSAAFLRMSAAWGLSVATQAAGLRTRWRALRGDAVRVELGDEGITFVARHGSRFLRWDALEARRLGDTWLFLVDGQEAAFLPHRCLSPDEARCLSDRAQARRVPGAAIQKAPEA